jgi:hypothetical protein
MGLCLAHFGAVEFAHVASRLKSRPAAAWEQADPAMKPMELLDFPVYAVQRLAHGTWLVRTQMGDPILPAVDVVVGGRPARLSARAGDHGRRYTNTAASGGGLTSHM